MPHTINIPETYDDPSLNLAIDTIAKGKQALIFCNTKRGAESQAERTAMKIKQSSPELEALAEKILHALSSPTKQCKRLAMCIRKGIAFHHAGLSSKQRELVETAFRDTTLKIICATPTLAMGVDLPAYRCIVRDVKRFSSGTSWGMSDIPVLEYEQMSGRAGRPGKEDKGEAILIAKDEGEREHLFEKYVHGDPEEIYSKLAVEPVLRTYVLSLIASGYVHDRDSLRAFFSETFYAFQYGDMDQLERILDKMVGLLATWQFLQAPALQQDEFVSASDLVSGTLKATPLGERVAQLYLDPYTAHELLEALAKARAKGMELEDFGLLHLLATTLEIRPLPSIRAAETEAIDALLVEHEGALLAVLPLQYSHEYEDFLRAGKLAAVLTSWIEEEGEDAILEKFGTTPGELHAKRDIADWLLHALCELAKIAHLQPFVAPCEKMRIRLEHGAKEELLGLLRLRGIGRVRARVLYRNKIRSLDEARTAQLSTLTTLLGVKVARSVKEQLGEKLPEEVLVKPNKRKGQINLDDFSEQ